MIILSHATTFGVWENRKRTRTSISTAPSKGYTNALWLINDEATNSRDRKRCEGIKIH